MGVALQVRQLDIYSQPAKSNTYKPWKIMLTQKSTKFLVTYLVGVVPSIGLK